MVEIVIFSHPLAFDVVVVSNNLLVILVTLVNNGKTRHRARATFDAPVNGSSRRNIAIPFGIEKLEWWGYLKVKKMILLYNLCTALPRMRHPDIRWSLDAGDLNIEYLSFIVNINNVGGR